LLIQFCFLGAAAAAADSASTVVAAASCFFLLRTALGSNVLCPSKERGYLQQLCSSQPLTYLAAKVSIFPHDAVLLSAWVMPNFN